MGESSSSLRVDRRIREKDIYMQDRQERGVSLLLVSCVDPVQCVGGELRQMGDSLIRYMCCD